jgi:hypothetical protein
MLQRRLASLAAVVLLMTASACSDDDGNASFVVRPSINQLYVTHAQPGTTLIAEYEGGGEVARGTTDQLGSLVLRKLRPGGYRVRTEAGDERSARVVVRSAATSFPDQEFYRRQKLVPGFQYLTMRDGTTLSAYVTLPGPVEMGPYPTVVSYSGYDPSKPGKPIGDFTFLCADLPAICDAPSDPGALLAALFGYATINVNMRGTGCSGGAYDFFEELQLLDGYDVIEIAGAQDWVLHHKVGMVGLSYPGITQLFVGSMRPPSLAAITPLSVIGSAQTTLLPGGILNDGFATAWITNVLEKAHAYGQGWERDRVDGGDTVCRENQLLHDQMIDNVAQAKMVRFYDPAEHDRYNPTTFVDKIEVPVFLAGSWQDEQTGPFFTTLMDRFTNAPALRMTVYNGVHPDGFAPQVLIEWQTFLELFVARRVPVDPTLVRDFSPLLFKEVFGTSALRLPPARFSGYATYDEAAAAWKAEPSLRVIFENGIGATDLGAPQGRFEHSFAAWPPPEVTPWRMFLQPDGGLADDMPSVAESASRFALDREAGQRGVLAPGGRIWDMVPAWSWRAPDPGRAVVATSAALESDHVLVGTGSADLWIRSTVDDADLEVTVSEVRPDGKEVYVQSGWLRASHNGLGPSTTAIWPDITYLEQDSAPLVPGEWRLVRVPIAGFGHVFRKGSRIRVIIDTPGDSRAEWRFANKTFAGVDDVHYDVGHDMTHASSVVLPLVDGVTAPADYPACPGLRGQPCREAAVYTNTPAN